MKFLATVVLYNPPEEVLENIKTYSSVVEKIYAIDNSEYTNEKIINELKIVDNLEYIPFYENKGIAHALNVALKKAIAEGADYLLTMDQDTSFRENDAKKMIDYINRHDNSKNALYAANTEFYKGREMASKVDLALTSGNMIHCDTIRCIGGFDEKLFIDWVDQDLCYRLMQAGYNIIKLNNIKINHQLGSKKIIKIFGFKKAIMIHNGIRYYYMVRNKFYVLEKNDILFHKRMRFIIGTIGLIIKIILLEDDKNSKIRNIYRGVRDFFQKKMGKYSYK